MTYQYKEVNDPYSTSLSSIQGDQCFLYTMTIQYKKVNDPFIQWLCLETWK